ncbi:galactan 5-O-arabinofuranosyltransferase [Blastococcus aurantiacus]|uniref:Galactan 5-O-arabinofuranosyltransferase n=1 Tax=Blastococcus aurantiacus TaxID=1550231 RepID=A0A1G7L0K9_9ACTN|nr:arabinofuranosyltransferase [Blastococcus aurantiacus]SDF42640.1 galactan 5-O-arabinofuranosyltransferase [Blastococcus aurantiacus]
MSTQVSPRTTPAEPAAPPPVSGGRTAWLRPVLPWVLVPLAVLAGYLVLPPAAELRAQYQASALVLVSTPLLAWLLTRASPVAHHWAGAVTAALLPALSLIALDGTDWYFSGPRGDQSFRMEYVTRFADSLALQDYTYRDVPAFYSPGWFWLQGLVSQVTDVEAWRLYKWASIVTLYLAVVVAFALWRLTCSTRLSALLVAVTVVGLPAVGSGWLGAQTLMFSGAYEPYGWLVALPTPALLAWFASARGQFSWRRGLALGAALAAAAWLYLLYALVAVVGVLAVAAWRRHDTARLREVVVAGLTSVVLVSPWLVRFVVEYLAAGLPPAAATTWVEGEDSYVHLVTASASPWLWVALLGAGGLLVLDGERHRRLRGVQALGVAVLLLGVVQLVAGQASGGVLFHRILLVLGLCLLAAAVLTLAAVAPDLRTRVLAGRPGLPLRRLAFAVLTVLLFLNFSAHAREWMNRDVDLSRLAHNHPYPDGTLPALASTEGREEAADEEPGEAPVTEVSEAIRSTARAAGQEETGVVLTDRIPLLATQPFHAYQQWWGLYANPLGEYAERRTFLESLEGLPADRFVERLRAEEQGPRVFALEVEDGEVTFDSTDRDAGGDRGDAWSVSFPVELLEGPGFESTRVGDWLVAALRKE